MPECPVTILGCLPVIAEVSFGYDSFTGEYYSDVDEIYWQKRNGDKGKPISIAVRDRANKYDPYWAGLIEEANEYLAHEKERKE